MTAAGRVGRAFVGRRAELARLEELLERGPDDPWAAAVEGPAGIGKSGLLREFSRRAAARGAAVLEGRASEFEQAVPFAPFLDAMDQLVGAAGGALPQDGAGPASSGLERHRLYRRLREALGTLSRQAPVVLVLDDLQWADDDTVGLLEFLLGRPPVGEVALVLSYRAGQCPARLDRALAAAAAPPPRLRLPPLGPADVDRLLPAVGPAHRRVLYRVGAGNPLYLLLLAELPPDAVAALDAPMPLLDERAAASLDRTVRAELAALPTGERLIAQAAAVAGREATADLVAAVAQVPEPEVLDRLDSLAVRGVLTAEAGRFGFAHPLLRAAAYRLAGPGWRITAHRRAVEHLARTGAPLVLRAQHLEHALRPGDTAGADELVEAARAALASAPATSAHWLEQVLRITPDQDLYQQPDHPGAPRPDPAARERAERIRLLLGRALLASGALERAGTVLRGLLADTALTDPAPTDPVPHRRETLALLAQCERILGRSAGAYELLRSEARAEGAGAGPLIVELATLDLMDGRIEEGMRRVHELAGCGDGGGPAIAAAGSVLMTLGAVGRGDGPAALAGLAEAGRRLDALSDDELRTILDAVLPALAWAAYLMERHEQALRQLDRGIRVARAHGHSYALPHLYAAQACTLTRLGRLAEAVEAAEDAEESARAFGAADMLAIAASVKLRSLLWRDGPRQVEEQWGAALRLPEPVADWFRRSVATILLDVGLQVGLEPPPDALERLGLDRPGRDDPMLATRCGQAALMAQARGELKEADAWCERAVAAAHAVGLPGQLAAALLARATLALNAAAAAESTPGAGAPADLAVPAAQDALSAARLFGEAGMPVQQGQAHLAAGEAAGRAGNPDEAARQFAAARALFAAVGAPWLDGLALRAQRSLAARQPRRRGHAAAHELSVRERQVAELVAQGLTNRDIGDRLYLSPRTVETHLARVFAKLGATSRAGVARLLPDAADPAEHA
jgi:DNA-binding CsgD family transcriptional regulator/tetratricopeptide (TPR) repeat protein